MEAKATSQLVDFPIIFSWYVKHSFDFLMHLKVATHFVFLMFIIARRGLDIAGFPMKKFSTGALKCS